MPSKSRHGFTFSLNPEVHKEFKKECLINCVEMSDVLNRFMYNYIEKSQEAREKNQIKNK